MQYIVFDCEFNQDDSSIQLDRRKSHSYFEIIQIGAIKLDIEYKTLCQFNRYIKPTIYPQVNPFITELTGITTSKLEQEKHFPDVFKDFLDFIGDKKTIFCIWGMSDIKELYRNASYHHLGLKHLPNSYINLQPYASNMLDSLSMEYSKKGALKNETPIITSHKGRLLRLQYVVEALNIMITQPFHDALSDAYYTAEIFKKIDHSILMPQIYDPTFTVVQVRHAKRVIDFAKLFMQFEKMYEREMTPNEKEIIRLAYQMGKTGQFIK
jgi:DNA polymerase III epsilon subunit-like protein